jgi:hypothetical protein
MELIEGSETSAISNQKPKKHPKENILHVKHGESLKSRNEIIVCHSEISIIELDLIFTQVTSFNILLFLKELF